MKGNRPYQGFLSCFLLLWVTACTPVEQPQLPRNSTPKILEHTLVMGDGAGLPYRAWHAKKPRAVIVALHGFNDYSKSFSMFGDYMKRRGVSVLSYDQRGFGKTEPHGIWGGKENLTADACDTLNMVQQKYRHTPVFLLGDSMGAAVAMHALNTCSGKVPHGLILVAPAVWGGETMNPFFRLVLWTVAHTMPDKKFTGEGLEVQATDNLEVLHDLSRDPWAIKATRADSIYGLLGLMDDAHADVMHMQPLPVLVLYGQRDEVVPKSSIEAVRKYFSQETYVEYPNGYHMLLRDLQRERVYEDINQWMEHQKE